jgi:hypothetical protein
VRLPRLQSVGMDARERSCRYHMYRGVPQPLDGDLLMPSQRAGRPLQHSTFSTPQTPRHLPSWSFLSQPSLLCESCCLLPSNICSACRASPETSRPGASPSVPAIAAQPLTA